MSIVTRLLLVILIALLPAISIHIYNSLELRSAREAELVERAHRVLMLIEAEKVRLAEGVRHVAAAVAATRTVRARDRDQCHAFLERLGAHLPKAQAIAVTDSGGTMICSTDPRVLGFSIADRAHFRQAMATGGFAVGEFIVRRATGEPVLPFALPYQDALGRTAGVVTVTVKLDWLNDYLSEKPLPANATLTVADRNGTILGRSPGGSEWSGRSLPDRFLGLLATDRPGIVEVPGLDGVPRILAYSPVASGLDGVFVSVGFDRRAMLREIDWAAARGIGIALVALLIALVAAWAAGRSLIRRPVQRLAATAVRWRAGDLSARANLKSSVLEIAMLGEAFNAMAAALQDREQTREAARAAEHRMAEVLASTTDGVAEIDRDWRFTLANERARLRIAGGGELIGQSLWEMCPDLVGSDLERQLRTAMVRTAPAEFEAFIAPLEAWWGVRASPSPHGLMVYFQDISDRKRAEEALALRARRQAAVAALGQRALSGAEHRVLMNEAVVRIADGLAVELADILEFLPDEGRLVMQAGVGWNGRLVGHAVVPADPGSPAGYSLSVAEPVTVGDLQTETRFSPPPVLRDHRVVSSLSVPIMGRERPFGVIGAHSQKRRAFSPEDVAFLQAIANVLTSAMEREAADEQIRGLALRDPLTGLPNRALLRDRLVQALGRARRLDTLVALVLLDLDHFKGINDMLGHSAGDRLLQDAAERLLACVRTSDTVARLGGDEFAVVLEGLHTPDDAVTGAEKAVAALAEPFQIEQQEVHTSASAGVSLAPDDAEDPDDLLHHADLALYRVKAERRGSYRLYAPEMVARSAARKALERDLRRALDTGALTLHYQPQIDLHEGKIIAAEVLLRWHHPEHGQVPPGEFIPLAEATGMMAPLGAWILRAACAQAQAWRADGLPALALAVNVSLAQCRSGQFAATVEDVLRATGFAPQHLELEVTENLFLEPEESACFHSLRRLRGAGTSVAIDDFGTGHSSVSRLRHLNVGTIKLDQMFVAGITHDPMRRRSCGQ